MHRFRATLVALFIKEKYMSGIKEVLSKAKKSRIAKEAKSGKDFGKKNVKGKSGFQSIVDKATKEYGSKKQGEKVAAAAFWKQRAKS